jgi:hypothetical protein
MFHLRKRAHLRRKKFKTREKRPPRQISPYRVLSQPAAQTRHQGMASPITVNNSRN